VNASPAPSAARLARAELTLLARSEWPARPPAELPPIPGFIISSFSPLAAELARRCLRQHFGDPPADAERGRRTAIVLASTTGDIATAAAIAGAVDQGRAVPPLLFYQSNPNAVAGHIAARWGLAGPVVCTIPAAAGPGALADAMDSAALLIEGAEADAALVLLADQGGPDGDSGVALLVGPAAWLDQLTRDEHAPAVRDIGLMSGTP
jgi:Beta-ketoacyl synthase, N-terminal domain